MDIGVAVAVIVALSLIELVSAGAVPSFFGRLAFLPLGHFRCGAEQPISRLDRGTNRASVVSEG